MSPQASRALLTAESFVLAVPAALGTTVCAGTISAAMTGERPLLESLPSILALTFLLVGVVLLIAFAEGGSRKARSRGRPVWLAAATGAVVSILAFVSALTMGHDILRGQHLLTPLSHGIFFVPSFLHLCAECWLRTEGPTGR